MYDYCHKHFPEKFWGRPLLLKAHVTCWVVTQYTVNSTFHRHYALWDSMLTTGYIKPNSRLYVLHRIWSIKHLQHEKFNNQRPWLGLPSGDFIVPDEGNWIFVTSLLVPTSLHPLEIHPSIHGILCTCLDIKFQSYSSVLCPSNSFPKFPPSK